MITKYTSEAALDFHTGTDEVHHAQLTNLAAMAQSIMHQVGTTEVADPALTTLVNFNGPNGALPTAGLIADAHGDLFGTTQGGGANGEGTVFEIAKTAHGYASTPTTLVSFNGVDGAGPAGSLIADAKGDLFGTTAGGGANNDGTVFEIAKTAHGYASTPTTLASFNGTDGVAPDSLIADSHGNLFGTAGGGSHGTVFEIAKTAHGYASTPTTVATGFVPSEGGPNGTLIANSHGNLFGTTFTGGLSGAHGVGTVFEIAKTAHGYASTPTTLAMISAGPESGLIVNSHGNLFGTAGRGGANDDGTVFEIAKTAHGYASTPTTLVSFNGTDGFVPNSLIADSHGNLFGTTAARTNNDGGLLTGGTVFEIAKTAHGYASTPTTLVSFNVTEGTNFVSKSLIGGSHGNLFGTTDGTVFEITDSGFSTHKTLSGPVVESHDSFLFAANLGEQTTTKFNVHNNAIDTPQSEFTQLAELSQAHQDAANLPHAASDPMHDAAMLNAQHAHHFLL